MGRGGPYGLSILLHLLALLLDDLEVAEPDAVVKDVEREHVVIERLDLPMILRCAEQLPPRRYYKYHLGETLTK